jgi:hypothetical protein
MRKLIGAKMRVILASTTLAQQEYLRIVELKDTSMASKI